jgi:hypothetical protein
VRAQFPWSEGYLAVHRGDGTGGFASSPMGVLDYASPLFDFAVADVMPDGRADVLYCIPNGTTVNLTLWPNATYAQPGPLQDLGYGLHGSFGTPLLLATGTFQPGTHVSFDLYDVPAGAPALFVAGLAEGYAPVKGGVLVPAPELVVGPMLTNLPVLSPYWQLSMNETWPAGIPPGTTLTAQYWIKDPAGPQGFSASTAVRVTAP